jgi:hypothetical protein
MLQKRREIAMANGLIQVIVTPWMRWFVLACAGENCGTFVAANTLGAIVLVIKKHQGKVFFTKTAAARFVDENKRYLKLVESV